MGRFCLTFASSAQVEEAEGAHSLHLKGIKGVLGTDSDVGVTHDSRETSPLLITLTTLPRPKQRLQQYGMPSSGRRAYRREQSIIFPVNDKTPQRAHVVRMCGWHPLNDESALDETLAAFVVPGEGVSSLCYAFSQHLPTPYHGSFSPLPRRLEENGDFERASALALFHHDLRRAVQSLSTVGSGNSPL